MREIKFRAWDNVRKVWAEACIMEFWRDKEPLLLASRPSVLEGILSAAKDDDICFEQYTGLKDKHGREIYEGDIIKGYEWQGVSEVTYQGGAYYPLVKADDGDLNWHPSEVEVIGNIHENPELLK